MEATKKRYRKIGELMKAHGRDCVLLKRKAEAMTQKTKVRDPITRLRVKILRLKSSLLTLQADKIERAAGGTK